MAIAGKVAITLSAENGGAWSADVTYDRLVAVKHNNNLYISRKVVTNVEPPNNEFWFFALEGYSGEDVQALIDSMNAIITGTQQVGNAKTLDGHGADEFLPKIGGTVSGVVYFNKGNESQGYGRINQDHNSENNYGLTLRDYGPEGNFVGIRISSADDKVYYRAKDTVHKELLHIGNMADHVLPLTGGTVANANIQPMYVQRNGNGNVFLGYKLYEECVGGIGFSAKDKPACISADGVISELLHTGTKPTGTYTGNGSTTTRQIEVGGIGEVLFVKSGNAFAIVSYFGALVTDGTTVSVLDGSVVNFSNGKLVCASTHSALNANGVQYKYELA